MSAARAVCEIPATNVEIVRQSGKARGKMSPPHSASGARANFLKPVKRTDTLTLLLARFKNLIILILLLPSPALGEPLDDEIGEHRHGGSDDD
jgi:hypothetical protein